MATASSKTPCPTEGRADYTKKEEKAETPRVEIYCEGLHVKVRTGEKSERFFSTEKEKTLIKTPLNTFSRGSRRSLRDTLFKADCSKSISFVTLTYPKNFPTDPSIWKRHIKSLKSRFHNHFPQAAGIWRLELGTKRTAAPNIHLVLWNFYNTEKNRQWLSKSWYDTVKSKDPLHLQAGTQIQHLDTIEDKIKTFNYVSKLDPRPVKDLGRSWGYIGQKEAIPTSPVETTNITKKQAQRLICTIKRWRKIPQEHHFTALSLNTPCLGRNWAPTLKHFGITTTSRESEPFPRSL